MKSFKVSGWAILGGAVVVCACVTKTLLSWLKEYRAWKSNAWWSRDGSIIDAALSADFGADAGLSSDIGLGESEESNDSEELDFDETLLDDITFGASEETAELDSVDSDELTKSA